MLEAAPTAQVLILSASDERDDVVEAVKAGACGYLVKSASAEELVAAVHATAEGQPVFTPGLAGLVLGEFRRMASAPEPAGPGLTARETEVLRLVAKGLSAKQIATRLHLSHRTVENTCRRRCGSCSSATAWSWRATRWRTGWTSGARFRSRRS